MVRSDPLPAPLKALYPFSGEVLSVPGGALHYLDEGPKDAPAVVCLHGNPTWSFYWRELVLALRDRYRVIVPDHLGCGLSDKPASGFDYRLQSHADNVERLLDHLKVNHVLFVLHDWGGAIGMGVATRSPERARGFVITNSAAFRSRDIPFSIALCRVPGFGALAVRGLNGFARAALFRATEKGLDPAVRQGLLYPYSSWEARRAIHQFVLDIPMHPEHPSWPTLVAIEEGLGQLRQHPMLLLWGDADFCFGPQFRRAWSDRFPQAEVRSWQDVGHYVMEDAGPRVVEAVEPFLETLAS